MAQEVKEVSIHGPEKEPCKIDMAGVCQNPKCELHLFKVSGVEEFETRERTLEERIRTEGIVIGGEDYINRKKQREDEAKRTLVLEAQLLLLEIFGEEKAPTILIGQKDKEYMVMYEEDLAKGRKFFLTEALMRTVGKSNNNWKLIEHLVKLETEKE